jgi:muramidase (phage lysozyme)
MDFTATSQDDAAIFLIKQKGALSLINAGQCVDAIYKIREVWASLPGGSSGQPQDNMADCLNVYSAAGGAYA